MQRIHRIYTEKFGSYDQAKERLINLNRKFSGRIKVNDVSSYISLPFFKRGYKVVYTIEDSSKNRLKSKKRYVVNKDVNEVKNSVEKIVQKTLNLIYPTIQNTYAINNMGNSLTARLLDGEFLKNAVNSGCVSKEILAELRKGVEKYIYNTIGGGVPLELNSERKVVALVGPTGVGKTTTCVKIGTKFFIERVPLSFVTLDLFRAGADQQLSSFTEHMGIKCNKIVDADMTKSIMRKLNNSKLIVVDTIGASQKDDEKLMHIKKILDVINPTEIFLVLPLNYSPDAAIDIIKKFSVFNFNRIVISKADESTEKCYPLLFSIRANAPNAFISYVTCGQYPQDIVEFDPNKFIEPIVSHYFKL